MTKSHQGSVFSDGLLDYNEAAKLLGIQPGTLRRWVSEGRISYVKVGSRRVRFRPGQLTEVMTEYSADDWGAL